MKSPHYYLTWNRKTFEYYCDGTFESRTSYRRHMRKVVSHYEKGDFDWVTLIKDNRKLPISSWEVVKWNLNSSLLQTNLTLLFVMPSQILHKLVVEKTTALIHRAYSIKSPDTLIQDLIHFSIFVIHQLLLCITCWRCSLQYLLMSSEGSWE